VTGGIAAVVDAGGFVLLVNAKLSIVVASCLSFCIAALVSYDLTSQFVLNREATPHGFAIHGCPTHWAHGEYGVTFFRVS
jgi:putative flippase GtrA